jgi:hypothetical protein
MGLEVRQISPDDRGDVDAFILLVHDLYRSDPAFVPPIVPERRDALNPSKNPFWDHAEVALFLAERDGRAVGRITAHTNAVHDEKYGDSTGFFGFPEFEDDPDVSAALLERAEQWLREKGRKRIIGPMSFDIHDVVGVLVEGFEHPPHIIMGHSLPHYGAHIEDCGYAKAKDLYAWRYTIGELNDLVMMMVEEGRRIEDLIVRPFDMKNMRRDVGILCDIYNDAWADNWCSLPISDVEADKVVKDLKHVVEPSLIRFAEHRGEAVAVSWGMLNYNDVLRRMGSCRGVLGLLRFAWNMRFNPPKTGRLVILGIKKKHRGGALRTLSVLLYHEMHQAGLRLGLTGGELGWTLEDNVKINRGIELMGGERYKTYRVYEKQL